MKEIIENDFVEVKRITNINMYYDWTRVSRFLSCGLQGVEVREIEPIKNVS